MIHKEGHKIIIIGALLVIVLNVALFFLSGGNFVLQVATTVLSLGLLAFLLWFFRSPVREIDADSTSVTAPADGRVVVIEKTIEREYLKDERLQISIFMSPFNMHSNKYPVSGVVKEVLYHPGKFLVAWHPKSSELNERSSVVIETEGGETIVVRQIAGAFARRIATYARIGDEVRQGDELGFIRFGSRVDIFLPKEFRAEVVLDQQARANRTRLGNL
jgi:phosphatidylserine decarboxylase